MKPILQGDLSPINKVKEKEKEKVKKEVVNVKEKTETPQKASIYPMLRVWKSDKAWDGEKNFRASLFFDLGKSQEALYCSTSQGFLFQSGFSKKDFIGEQKGKFTKSPTREQVIDFMATLTDEILKNSVEEEADAVS